MVDKHDSESQDKTRLCPTCRTPISILATKCRFCGDEISRKREEDRHFTVHDLGGEQASKYGMSSDALEALEAYRREEYLDSASVEAAAPSGKNSGPRRTNDPRPSGEGAGNYSPPTSAKPAGRRPASGPAVSNATRSAARVLGGGKVRVAATVVGGALVFLLIAGFAKGKLDSYLAGRGKDDSAMSVKNRAVAILERGGPGIEALEAAHQALQQADNPENQKIADQARQKVKADVYALLNADPWSPKDLNKASELASRAEKTDPDGVELRNLYTEVNDDIRMYKMTISKIDGASEEVTLRVLYPNPDPDLVVKRKDDLVHNRFKIREITPEYVRFQDVLRKTSSGRPREFRLFLSGEIVVL